MKGTTMKTTADKILSEINDSRLREEVEAVMEKTGLPADLALVAVKSGEEGILVDNFTRLQQQRKDEEESSVELINNLRNRYRELIKAGNAREAISVKNRIHNLGGTI